MIKTPFEDLPTTIQNMFIKLVEEDAHGLQPSTLYNNTVLTAQNSGVDKASEFMNVSKSIVSDILDLNNG